MLPSDDSLLKVLKAKSSGTVAIFDKGEYYCCYSDDALLLSSKIFMSDVCIKSFMIGDEKLQYLTLNAGQYQRVVRELIMLMRYRVELYELINGINGQWILKAKGTVGNVGDFEDIVGDAGNGTTIMALRLGPDDEENVVNICVWDMSELRIVITQLRDSPIFAQVEQCIIGLNPRECVVFDSETSGQRGKKISSLLLRTDVMETHRKMTDMADWNDVKKIFKQGTDVDNISDASRDCLRALYNYLKMDEQDGYDGKMILSPYQSAGFLHLDASAVRSLELFNLSYSADAANNLQNGTLFNHLNKCKTLPGERLLREWIARPLCDLRQIEERQDVIQSLLNSPSSLQNLHSSILSRIPDTAQLARRLVQNKAKLQDCYRIYQTLTALRQIESCLQEIVSASKEKEPAIKELMLEPICYGLIQFTPFAELIRSTIDMKYVEKTGLFRITPTIDAELSNTANEMESIEKSCHKAASRINEKLGMESIKLDSNSQHGFFYRVTLKDEKNIRKNKEITILDTTKGSGMRFRDEKLTELNIRYNQLDVIYQKAQKTLEQQVVNTCAGYASSLSSLTSTLATIDVLVSLSIVASQSSHGYIRPKLSPMGSGKLELYKCRHPVLETIISTQFIPNDVILGDSRLIILTGANMGGKSTYLRSAALCVLMAQIGSYIPCESAQLSLVDGIFTRIGASDQQTRGISTFMAEMLDTASILQTATSNSLVIVDELGRGTSTFDGFGLAWAIANDLLNRTRCFCLFATHFHEMGELSKEDGAIAMQMTVSIEDNQLAMLYEIRPGVAQSSYGIHVARAVGFNEDIIQRASSALSVLENPENVLKARLKAAKGEELRQLILSL